MFHISTNFIPLTQWHNEEESCCFHVFLQSEPHYQQQARQRHHKRSELGLVSLGQRHLEPVLHVHGERQLGRDGVAVDDMDAVAVEDGGRGELHLVVGEVLAEAQAGAAIEGGELVGGLAHEAAVPEPPLRLVLPAVVAPDALHPPHGVHGVDHLGALLQHRPVREHLVLHHLSCVLHQYVLELVVANLLSIEMYGLKLRSHLHDT